MRANEDYSTDDLIFEYLLLSKAIDYYSNKGDCDLADNGSVPVRIHFCIKFLYQWLKRPLQYGRSIERRRKKRKIKGKIVYTAYIVYIVSLLYAPELQRELLN